MIELQHTETSSLQFIKWTDLYETEKPYQIFIDLPPTTPRTNVDFEVKDVLFRDIRGSETEFDIDEHGFMMCTTKNFEDLDGNPSTDRIEKVYLPEVEELLKREVKGVDRLKIFDWRVRFSHSLCLILRIFLTNKTMGYFDETTEIRQRITLRIAKLTFPLCPLNFTLNSTRGNTANSLSYAMLEAELMGRQLISKISRTALRQLTMLTWIKGRRAPSIWPTAIFQQKQTSYSKDDSEL
jgi:hypothetical protein